MSLEQALLDRLEKRSLQVAQKENEIYGLRELVDEKMTINEQLSEQITSARLERAGQAHRAVRQGERVHAQADRHGCPDGS